MSQIDEISIHCKVTNLDMDRHIGYLVLFEPVHHWPEDPAPVCVGEFASDQCKKGLSAKEGDVLHATVAWEPELGEHSIFWIPEHRLSAAKNPLDPCLTTQLSPEALSGLRRKLPPKKGQRDSSWIKVKSTTVNFVRYIDLGDMGCALDVVFYSSSGQYYRYFDVARWVFDDMLASTSPGGFFFEHIKNHACEKFDFDEKDPGPY